MFITSGDARLFTVSFGQAQRTLLAVGGWTGSWELWTLPFGYLSTSWRTVAYDHRGSGTTNVPIESITFEAMVNDVFVVMDAMGIESCVLAGESFGGAVVMQAALQHPERIQGIVLADAMYFRPPAQGKDMFLLGLQHQYEATVGSFVDTCLPEPDSEDYAIWGRKILMRASQDAAIRLYQMMSHVDLRASSSQISQPTLILHGAEDRIVPPDASRWLASQIAQSHLEIFEQTGHVPTVTRPREVAAAINQFFAS